jgi:hypothetical protein
MRETDKPAADRLRMRPASGAFVAEARARAGEQSAQAATQGRAAAEARADAQQQQIDAEVATTRLQRLRERMQRMLKVPLD